MTSYLESIFFRIQRQAKLTGGLTSERSLVPERDTSDTLTLPDGRQLGFAQYGLLTGKPVFYCHGLPGSRVEAGHLHEEAFATGVRIIATDRPGMGLSTPQPDRTLLDHPKDLELLADHLKLSEYGVLVRRISQSQPTLINADIPLYRACQGAALMHLHVLSHTLLKD